MSESFRGPPPSETEINKPLIPKEKTPQELTNERIQRLEELAKDFTLDQTSSAIRVHEFLQHENDSKHKSWEKFKTIDDWQLYHQLNPDWQGLNIKQMTKIDGGCAFYRASSRWVNKSINNLPENQRQKTKRELIEQIFPNQNKDWSNLKTIEDWQNEFNKHPEWQGLNAKGISRKDGGRNFYEAFHNWTNKLTINLPENQRQKTKRELIEQIFPNQNKDWSNLKTIEDWQNEFNKHPNWQGLNTVKITKVEGGSAFYTSFKKWANKQLQNFPAENREKIRKQLTKTIFSPKTPNTKKETTKSEKLPEIISNNLPSNPIDFSQQEKMPSNFISGITTNIVDTTIETDEPENDNNNGNNYNITSKRELTPAQIILLMCAKGNWNGEFYAKHSGEIASYLINRGQIAYLLKHFFINHQNFPQNIVDLGSGPSMAYSAYQEFQPEMEKLGFKKPIIIDIDKDPSMVKYGTNPNRIEQDITQRLPFKDQQVDMVQSTFVIHRLKSQEILQTLIEANRITKTDGYLSLVCNQPFSKSFLSSMKKLGYQVITEHGEILTPNKKMLDAVTQQTDLEHADRLKNKFKKAFILVAQKIDNINQLPSSETFTFDQAKKNHRERKPILDLKNYDIETSPLTENIERITDSIICQLHQLEVSPFRQESGLSTSNNEIRSDYEIFNWNLSLIQSLYDKIYIQIRGRFNTLNQEQISNFNQLREQLKIAKEYKKNFYKRHIA